MHASTWSVPCATWAQQTPALHPPTARLAVLGSTPRQHVPEQCARPSPTHSTLGSAGEYSSALSASERAVSIMQASLARYVVPNASSFAVMQGMVAKFEELVYTNNIAQEILLAQEYLKGPAAQASEDSMQPMGITVSKSSSKYIYEQFQKVEAPVTMSFSATIWMLDLSHRLLGIDKLDLARMRWAVEQVQDSGSLHKVMDGLPVAAESVPDAEDYKGLRKIERDADLDAVILAIYWNRPDAENTKHPWHDHLRDLHFKAQKAGQGAAASVERFVRFDEEEKKRKVMGLSTFRRAQELKILVDAAAGDRQQNECDAAMASRILGSKEVLKAAWSEDTCRRYLLISERFNAESTQTMSKWEMKFGRSCLLDSLSTMRSAVTAAQTEEQMNTLVNTLFWEQTCKMRSSLEGRTKVGGGGNATAILRAILLRNLFYQYVQQIFPKLKEDVLDVYGTWRWFNMTYGMDEHGRMSNVADTDSEDDKHGKDDSGPQTRFESKRKLKLLMDQVAKGKFDTAFCAMARQHSSSLNLDLGCEGMAGVQKQVHDIYGLYKAEFPEESRWGVHPGASTLPSTEIDINASAGVYTPAHVKASSRIESQEEYQAKLSAYQEECRKAQENSIKEHIDLRVVMVVSDLDATKINRKLERVSFMKEPGRKLFLYDSLCQDPLNWAKLRSMKRSFLTGAKVTMMCQQAGQIGADTLAPLKDVYLNFRRERDPDSLSEDIVATIVPGVTQDKPTNEYLDAAWRSLRALGNKHVGPKIGQVVQNKQALLQNVYTRGVWSRAPDHHLVFTFQTMPRNSNGRKRMKYLSEGGMFGDTAFNSWPVPLVQLASMPKATQKEHDDIFENDAAEDSGAEDGTGSAAVQDLGDKVIPFPREMSEMLTREMIHVFEIDVGVFLTPASGKSLMAIILENRRAVAVVKNKAQREFIMSQLMDGVKVLNLAADRRPAKPHELTAWESSQLGSNPRPSTLPPPGTGAGGTTGAAQGASTHLPPPQVPPPAVPKGAPPQLPPPAVPTGASPPPAAASPPAAGGLAAFGAQMLR